MEALSLEVLLSSFSERKQKFVRQREGGTASQSRKREQRHGAMGGHPVGRQESTRFWISPERSRWVSAVPLPALTARISSSLSSSAGVLTPGRLLITA